MSDLNSQYIIAQEEHDYNKKYEEGTIVKHTIDDTVTSYIARKNVPQFISILNENYWKKIASTEEGGTVDYDNLKNKPSINGVELEGNITTKDLGIDNKFKGWFDSSTKLNTDHPSPHVGDFAYVHDASPATTVSIYRCATEGTWADSGDDVDTSLVQTFASSQSLNEVHIINDLISGGEDDVLSAEQGKVVNQLAIEVDGFEYTDNFTITATGQHSSTTDRITFSKPIPAGEYVFLVEPGTTGNVGICGLYPKYVGENSPTSIGSPYINVPTTFTTTKAMESIGIYMGATINQNTGTMPIKIYSVSSAAQKFANMSDYEDIKTQVYGTYSTELSAKGNIRLSKGVSLNFHGKCRVSISVKAGTDTGKWRILSYTSGSAGSAISEDKNFGEYVDIDIPSTDDGIWVFTTLDNITQGRVYTISITNIEETLNGDVVRLENDSTAIKDFIGYDKFKDISITKSAYARVNQALYTGYAGQVVKCTMLVKSGTDTNRFRIYKTNEDVTGTNGVIVDWTYFGEEVQFTVPENGYIWLFTEATNLTASRTYGVSLILMSSIAGKVDNLSLAGKTIVCFGDSITEFKYQDMGWCDWMASYTGANVINVGIGGAQFRQRTTPTATPTNQNQCYAGLEILTMVQAAMSNDFTIPEAAAAKLATISSDDDTAIVARLKTIDWNKVDIVYIMGGGNDWRNNEGNTGDKTSTSLSTTCGAINKIIELIGSTYNKIKLYFGTPTLLFIDAPEFSTTTSYAVGDMCTYNNGYYEFINTHLGEWNDSDVQSIQRSAFRIPEYSSDNYVINGKNLREFSAIIEEVVVNNHIPICDLYNTLGWNIYNFAGYYNSSDNSHPYYGFKPLGEKIGKFLMSN